MEFQHNDKMQQTILLAHEFAFANCAPTLRDRLAADFGVLWWKLRHWYEFKK